MRTFQHIKSIKRISNGIGVYVALTTVLIVGFIAQPERTTADTLYVQYVWLETRLTPQFIPLVASTLAHKSWSHLVTNLAMLLVPVVVIASQYSPRTLFTVSVITTIGANVVLMIVGDLTTHNTGYMIGASTVSYGLVAAWGRVNDTPVAGRINEQALLAVLVLLSMLRMYSDMQFFALFRKTETISYMTHTAHLSGAVIGYYTFDYVR